jgi:Mce-associated membrane protein
VEDQQPGSGDLTDSGTRSTEDVIIEESDDGIVDEIDIETEDEDETLVEPVHKEPSGPRKWLAANKTKALIGAAAGSFVLAGAFAGGALQPYLADRAGVATKMNIARTAVDAITTLWTYSPEDMDKLPERSAKFLSGDLQNQYRKFVDAIAATNKQAQVTNKTQVVATAVESLQGNEATALVFTNTESTSPKSKIPSMKYLSYRLDLKRQGTQWKVTKMSTVTSLDLTPKL